MPRRTAFNALHEAARAASRAGKRLSPLEKMLPDVARLPGNV